MRYKEMRDNSLRFKVADHDTWYAMWPVSDREAKDVGCPGATYRLIGPRTMTETYGTFVNLPRVPHRRVKVPGTDLHGRHIGFLAYGNDPDVLLDGYIVGGR